MPTYQYACTACDHRFEAVQAFTDPSLTECPECAGRLRKVYGSVGVVFKGTGFYRTDSRAHGRKKSGSTSSNGSESATGNGSTKTETSAGTPAGKSGSTSTTSSGSSGGGSGSSSGSSSTSTSTAKAAAS